MELPGRELPPPPGDETCLACGPRHPFGLRMRFFDDGDRVRARLLLTEAHGGHGGGVLDGLSFLVMDEAMAWCGRARLEGPVAGDGDSHFVALKPVKPDLPLFVEAWRVGPPQEDGWWRFQAHLRQEGEVKARLHHRLRRA